jgi:hypothetical protein
MSIFRLVTLALFAGALATAGCATFHHAHRPPASARPVTIESRPTPPPPESTAAHRARRAPPAAAAASSLRVQAAHDTAAAGARLRRCADRRLLPDQQNTRDAAAALLAQTRVALLAGDLVRARSLAREARQLSAALNCP